MSASIVPLRPASKAQGLLRIAEGLRTIAQGCEELAQVAAAPQRSVPTNDEDVTVEEAMRKTGLKREQVLRLTRGLPWRRRYSHNNIRFERAGFERWRKGASR